MNSYRRGLRNGVLVNLKLFIIEKVNLAPPTFGWSTWSNLVKLVKNLYYLVRVITRMHIAHEVGAVREGRRNNAEGYEEEEPYQVEETKYMNEQSSYHFKPNPNLPTHYNPALRNHESFSYGGKAQQGTRYEQNHHQAYTQPGFQQQQQHQQQRESRGEYQG